MTPSETLLRLEVVRILHAAPQPSDMDLNVYSAEHYIVEEILALIEMEKRKAVEEFAERFNKANDWDNGISVEDGSTYWRVTGQMFLPKP